MSLKFGQIQPLVSMVTDRVMMGKTVSPLFSSPEPKAHGELIVYQSSRRPSVRPSVRLCVHTFKH